MGGKKEQRCLVTSLCQVHQPDNGRTRKHAWCCAKVLCCIKSCVTWHLLHCVAPIGVKLKRNLHETWKVWVKQQPLSWECGYEGSGVLTVTAHSVFADLLVHLIDMRLWLGPWLPQFPGDDFPSFFQFWAKTRALCNFIAKGTILFCRLSIL